VISPVAQKPVRRAKNRVRQRCGPSSGAPRAEPSLPTLQRAHLPDPSVARGQSAVPASAMRALPQDDSDLPGRATRRGGVERRDSNPLLRFDSYYPMRVPRCVTWESTCVPRREGGASSGRDGEGADVNPGHARSLSLWRRAQGMRKGGPFVIGANNRASCGPTGSGAIVEGPQPMPRETQPSLRPCVPPGTVAPPPQVAHGCPGPRRPRD
jgi:hypothetical protein